MSRTTRKAPYDVEQLFPFLMGTARRTLRLHPQRRANVSPLSSKVGGAFAWPAAEAHPICKERGCLAVPLLQLRKDDIPSVEFPPGCNVCQLLWYPHEYPDWGYNPKVEVYWRDLATLSPDSIIISNDPRGDCFDLHECRVHVEVVIEYPYIYALSQREQEVIREWEGRDIAPIAHYQYCLSTCPGSKVGGYPDFGGQDPQVPVNSHGEPLDYLLTLSDDEWDGGSFPRWRPIEQKHPPGRTVMVTNPDRSVSQTTQYTAKEKLELKKWTMARRRRYWAAERPLGTYLKNPMNVFLDKSTSPWVCRTT